MHFHNIINRTGHWRETETMLYMGVAIVHWFLASVAGGLELVPHEYNSPTVLYS